MNSTAYSLSKNGEKHLDLEQVQALAVYICFHFYQNINFYKLRKIGGNNKDRARKFCKVVEILSIKEWATLSQQYTLTEVYNHFKFIKY